MGELELETLARQYNLRIQVLPKVTLVYSKFDHWMVEFGKNNMAILKHFNNFRVDFKTHNQILFNSTTASWENILSYISSHDHNKLGVKEPAYT